MDTSSVGAASDTNSLVGFGEGARTPARYSTVGSPNVSKNTPTASSLSQPFFNTQRDSSLTPVSAQAQAEQQDAKMIDGMTYDRGVVDTVDRTNEPHALSASSGAETAERIIRERLGPDGDQRGLDASDASRGSGRDLGRFYFESIK